MKDRGHPETKLKDVRPLEVVLLALEKAWRECLAVIDSVQGQRSA
jgi:hypothetical protein